MRMNDLNEWIKNGCDNEVALKTTYLFLPDKIKIFPIEICKLINLKQLLLLNNDLDTIPKEISNLVNLEILYFENENLTEFPKEIGSLINLKALILRNSKSLKLSNEIYNLTNLEDLELSNNNLTELPKEICNFIKLKSLRLHNNKLTTLPNEIGNLINLESLDINDNNLRIIPNEIGNLTKLTSLNASNNNLTSIPVEIGKLINLDTLYFSHNNLTTLPDEIGNLIDLTYLFLDVNKLTTIPITITNIESLALYYSNNPIEYIPPQVVRYLNRNKTTQQIYNDNQSVHNYYIQEGIKKSINYIMSIKPIYKLNNLNNIIINNTFINNDAKTILFEYINCQDVHSVLNVTFAELLINVLSFIDQHISKKEIYKVLEQEMNDAICKCFTGRMSRLINCLNGFDDNIVINISDNDQIGNIIILIKERLITENTYTVELHKDIVIKELYDRGYTKDVIDEWIQYI
jgi:Leucine-rich repeat (LRR) protein